MSRRLGWTLGLLLLLPLCIFAGWYFWQSSQHVERVLNLLCWTGYEEPALLEPFEKKYGVRVQYKTFVGGDAMYALLTQSRGQYDVVVVDPEYIRKLYDTGRLSALNPSDYNNLSDYIPYFHRFSLACLPPISFS